MAVYMPPNTLTEHAQRNQSTNHQRFVQLHRERRHPDCHYKLLKRGRFFLSASGSDFEGYRAVDVEGFKGLHSDGQGLGRNVMSPACSSLISLQQVYSGRDTEKSSRGGSARGLPATEKEMCIPGEQREVTNASWNLSSRRIVSRMYVPMNSFISSRVQLAR